EIITQSSHLEKVGLFEIGVGKDSISDFTTNLIKEYLLTYTQTFAEQYVDPSFLKVIKVDRVYFVYDLERWMPKKFNLPFIFDDYVILTPRDILTRDENWINSKDLRGNFDRISISIPNDQLRNEINNYFQKRLPKPARNKKNTQKELNETIQDTIRQFPEILKWYIKFKEENKEGAKNISEQRVQDVETIFIHQLQAFVEILKDQTSF